MRFTIDFNVKGLGDLARLRRELEDTSPLMKQLGAIMVSASQKAFREQRYGGEKWAPRYPNQGLPKFNVAGALADFKSGRRSPKPVRFDDRPALVDEGMRGGLWGSISSRVDGPFTVSVGTSKTYASLMQEGGTSIISYDNATKERILDWLYTKRNRPIPGKVKKATPRAGRWDYVKYLRPLTAKGRNALVTRVNPRPFLGIHEQLAEDMLRTIRDYFDRRLNRR